jgi:HD-like signal output (HDOD) protein/signal transduction histidine kinase
MDHHLLARIETSRSLPTLPHILLQLIDICNRQEKGIKELGRLINQDPSLSERVLRLVNSAHFSLKHKVTSIEQALLLLGMDAVKNVAISSSIYQVFHRSRRRSAFDLKLFWWHSLSCAAVARLLARKLQYPTPEEAFLSGLLHDIGKIVLWTNFEEEYERILKTAGEDAAALLQAEKELGLTHAEVGAWLIGRWDLRSLMPDALQYHHDPVERIEHAFPLVQIVYAANQLCQVRSEDLDQRFALAGRAVSLKRGELDRIVDKAEEEVKEIAGSLEIEITPPAGEEERPQGGHDQVKYEELAGWVRDVSLLQSFSELFLKAKDRRALLAAASQGLQLLFDVHSIFYFHHDEAEKCLVGHGMGSENGDLIRELVIPFQEEGSLLVRSLLQRRIMDTFSPGVELSILDEQLVRFLDGEGMLCLPLCSETDQLGVFILGLQRSQRERLLSKRKLLTMFVNLTALALYSHRLRERQAERIREERLAAASLLARKVVHEAQNPLGIMNNYLAIMGGKLSDNQDIQEDLRILREEIRRVSQIISELSSFSAPVEAVREPVDINAVVRDLLKLTQDSLSGSRVRLRSTLAAALPAVRTDRNRLKQVLINLLKNSSEAMPTGGTVSLETRQLPGEPAGVEVLVRDEGPGIPEEIQAHLFEPYTSSKGHEGLGLCIAYNIVKELGGSLSFDTGASGTTFRVRLPTER